MNDFMGEIGLPDWVALRSKTHADVLAISSADESLSYEQLQIAVSHAAGQLLSIINKSTRPIAILTGSSVDFSIILHSTIRISRAILPLNTRLMVNELR